MNRPRLRSGDKNNKGDENNESMRSENKNDDCNSHHGNGLLYYMDFNRIRIMKLINIPFIAETGTYYIDTDIVEDGIPVQIEFYVVIKYDYDEWAQSFNDLLIMVDCQDDELSHEDQRALEAHLYNEIYDYLNY